MPSPPPLVEIPATVVPTIPPKEFDADIDTPTEHTQIQDLAYELWEDAGRPAGNGQSFWFKAKKQLADLAEMAARDEGLA